MLEISNEKLIPVSEPEMVRGLPNMLNSEFASWWKTRKWVFYAVISTFLVNVMVFLLFTLEDQAFQGQDKIRQGMTFYALFGFLVSAGGIIIAMQDAIIGEKQTGTASWVLSKPISRRSFIISKFISNFVGISVTLILFPAIFVWLQVGLFQGEWLSFVGFMKAVLLLTINGFFFLTLTLLLGALFDNRSPLLGLSLAFLFGMQYLTSIHAKLIEFIPYPIGNQTKGPALVVQAIYNESFWTWNPILTCVIGGLAFFVGAILRFDREEF